MIACDLQALICQIGGECFGVLDGQGVDDSGLARKLGRQEVRQLFDARLVRLGFGANLKTKSIFGSPTLSYSGSEYLSVISSPLRHRNRWLMCLSEIS